MSRAAVRAFSIRTTRLPRKDQDCSHFAEQTQRNPTPRLMQARDSSAWCWLEIRVGLRKSYMQSRETQRKCLRGQRKEEESQATSNDSRYYSALLCRNRPRRSPKSSSYEVTRRYEECYLTRRYEAGSVKSRGNQIHLSV